MARLEVARSVAPLPGILAALLPKATCPVCVAAYAGAVSALGLGFLLTDRVLNPIILGSVTLSVGSVVWAAGQRRRPIPIALALIGAAAVICGRMIWSAPLAIYGGTALLVGASLWTLWLNRQTKAPLVQIRATRRGGNQVMKKRTVEIFTAGCPCCDEAVQLVKSITCENCDVQILDMRSDKTAQARAKEYGIKRVPAIVVNGQLADCCQGGAVDASTLRTLGIGSPA